MNAPRKKARITSRPIPPGRGRGHPNRQGLPKIKTPPRPQLQYTARPLAKKPAASIRISAALAARAELAAGDRLEIHLLANTRTATLKKCPSGAYGWTLTAPSLGALWIRMPCRPGGPLPPAENAALQVLSAKAGEITFHLP